MADFDWTRPERIGREAVEAALRLDFLDKAQNIVLVANQGLGKTMIDSVRLRSTWRFRRERPAWLNRPLLYPLEPRHPPGIPQGTPGELMSHVRTTGLAKYP